MFEKLLKYNPSEYAAGQLHFMRVERTEWVILALLLAVAAAVVFYRFTPPKIARRWKLILSTLRGVALALLALFLLHPVLRLEAQNNRSNFVALMVDDSRSMSISDENGGKVTRLDRAKNLVCGEGEDLKKSGGLRGRIEELCPTRCFKFSSDAQSLEHPAELKGRGGITNLYRSLKHVRNQMQGIPTAAVVLLSDGAYNSGGAPQELARQMGTEGIPIFTVGFGDPLPTRDLEVVRVHAPKEVRKNSEVEVFAIVRATGLKDPFDVILKRKDEVLQKVQVTPGDSSSLIRVKLGFQPDTIGTFKYTVEMPPFPAEKIVDNNRTEFLLHVTDRRLPVLYVEGSPRTEFRFLRRALYKDKDFRIASILRTANVQRQPLVQDMESGDGIETGYPKRKEDLFRFEAVIFGDIEAGYFSAEQLKMTDEFVRERGGGFLMLGGVNAFNLGSYQGSIVEKMLPVTLESAPTAYDNRELRLLPTALGLLHPILHQTEDSVKNRNIWRDAPPLIGINPLKGVKPGAVLLASDSVKQQPLLAVQNYGAGRTAAFATGGSWRWRMSIPLENEIHEKFWKQLIRWLAVGSKEKVSIEVDKDIYVLGESVELSTTVLGKNLEAVNDAEVVALVSDPAGNVTEYPQQWVLSREGVYQTQFKPSEEGEYTVTTRVKFQDGVQETATATFSVGETFAEYRESAQNVDVLREMARASGGQYYVPDKAADVLQQIRELLEKKVGGEKVFEDKDIWDAPLLFILVVVSLLSEWLIRRRVGLA